MRSPKFLPAILLLFPLLLWGADLNRVLVISIDGLDHRYLAERDAMRLKIPNLRALIRKGQLANGVVGVVPTVTWPSHSTLITGVRPYEHGVLSNRRPAAEGGDYYWTYSFLKVPTLLARVREAGGTTAAITWPVTVDAPVTFNLPEFFRKRNGGAMDLASIAERANPPGLIEEIRKRFPSFGTQWMDDRARSQAAIYLLESKRPNLLLLHLVDLDSEQHDRGPFTPEARAMLEYADELVGAILRATPAGYRIVLTSDHGFEHIRKSLNPLALAKAEAANLRARLAAGLLLVDDQSSAQFFIGKEGIGREVPRTEIQQFAPELDSNLFAAFEPSPGFEFSIAHNQPYTAVSRGEHGLWPGRAGYRSVYLSYSPGNTPHNLPELRMTDICSRLEQLVGLPASASNPASTPR